MKNGSTIGLIVAGVGVLFMSAFAGYYYLGGNAKGQTPPASAPTTQAPPAPVLPNAPIAHRPVTVVGEYTAPGAPAIDITESKAPLKTKPAASPAPTDSEASQTGLDNPAGNPAASETDAGSASGSTAAPSTTGTGSSSTNSGQTGVSTSGDAAPSDTSTTSQSGSTSSATVPPAPPAIPSGSASASPAPAAVLFHVQAGSFQNEKNAKTLAEALRHKGYAAMTLPRQTDTSTSYVVQVGAYSSRATADDVVSSLQRDGFPASVSTGQ
jgi:DedD protein